MIRAFCLASVFFLLSLALQGNLQAQEQQQSGGRAGTGAGQRRQNQNQIQSLALDINARVLADGQNVIWNENQRKTTIPGSPVGIRLVGSNIVVAVQFTPLIRRQGNVLIAQGQIWIEEPGGGVSYYTSIQTIPMDFNEPIYFFPLGSGTNQQLNASIEIILTVSPNRANEN
ncbi:MAG: hypothetical protein FWD28_02680 [Treponema sp.]|nr:hypothetical protein [Treponema sp.]